MISVLLPLRFKAFAPVGLLSISSLLLWPNQEILKPPQLGPIEEAIWSEFIEQPAPDYRGAQEAFFEKADALPGDNLPASFYAAWAEALAGSGNLSEAVSRYDQAIQLDSETKWMPQRQAMFRIFNYDLSNQALQIGQEILINNPDFHYLREHLMWALLTDKNMRRTGQAAAMQALELFPQRSQYHWGLAYFYYQTKRFEDALESYKKAGELSLNDNAGLFIETALTEMQLGFTDQAIVTANRGLVLDPEYLNRQIANSFYALEYNGDAVPEDLPDYSQLALILDPDNFYAHFAQLLSAREEGNLERMGQLVERLWETGHRENKRFLEIALEHYGEKEDTQTILELCNLLVDQEPDNTTYRFTRARASAAQNQFERAIADMEEIASLHANLPIPFTKEALVFFANLLLQVQRYDEAGDRFEEAAIYTGIREISLSLQAARAYGAGQQFEKALEVFEGMESSVLYTPQPEAIRLKANLLFQKGNFPAALAEMDKLIQKNPDDLYLQLAQAYMAFEGLGRESASPYIEALETKSPELFKATYNEGIRLAQENQFENAIIFMAYTIMLEPEAAEPYYERALLHAKLGEYTKAFNDFERASALQPDNLDVAYALAQTYGMSREYAKMASTLDPLVEANPQVPELWISRGQAYINLKDWARTIRDLEKGLELAPDNTNAIRMLTEAYVQRGDIEGALPHATRLAELDASQYQVHFQAYQQYLEQGKLQDALAMITICSLLQPNSPEAWNFRAMLHAELKQIDAYNAAMDELIRLFPVVQNWMAKGFTNLNQENFGQSVSDFSAAIDIEPDNSTAYSLRSLGYFYLFNLPKAQADNQKALDLNPSEYWGHFYAGLFLLGQKDFAGAARAFRQQIDVEEANANFYTYIYGAYCAKIASDPLLASTFINRLIPRVEGEGDLAFEMNDMKSAIFELITGQGEPSALVDCLGAAPEEELIAWKVTSNFVLALYHLAEGNQDQASRYTVNIAADPRNASFFEYPVAHLWF